MKANYIVSEEISLPLYKIPKHIRIAIKRGIVPGVLNQSLSPLSYSDYFATLLYAEELYLQVFSSHYLTKMEIRLLFAILTEDCFAYFC